MLKIKSPTKKAVLIGAVLLAVAPVFASNLAQDEALDRMAGLFDHPWQIKKIRINSRWKLPHELLPGLPPYNQQVANAQLVPTQPPAPTPKPVIKQVTLSPTFVPKAPSSSPGLPGFKP